MKRWDDFRVFVMIIVAAIIGGGVPVFIKIAVEDIPPFPFTFLRFVAASLIILPFLIYQKQSITFKSLVKAWPIALFGMLNVTLFAFGIRYTTASSAQMLYTVGPLLVGIFSYYLLKEKLNNLKIIGIALGFIGALLIILLPLLEHGADFKSNLGGNLIVFLAVCSFTLYAVFSKIYQKNESPLSLTAYFILITTIISFLISATGYSNQTYSFSGMTVLGILYAGIGGTGIFYLMHQYIVKHATATVASTVSYLQPAFTIIWAILLLNEKLTPIFIIGTILTFVGVYLVAVRRKEIINER